MMNREKREKMWRRVSIFFLSILTVIGFAKSIVISLDIDESYAIAQSYRMAIGDRLFVDMWEPHQLSAFLAALFIKLYLVIAGTTNYMVIYLRIIGSILHIATGCVFFRALKKANCEGYSAALVLLVHLNFLPKWVQMPEFELMHYWTLVLIASCMIFYFHGSAQKRYPILAGVFLVICMCCYPTMILLYPAYGAGWVILEKLRFGKKGIETLKSIISFTIGSLGSGLGLIAYLLIYQTPGELIENLANILMDQSHTNYTMGEKWRAYGEQLLDQLGEVWGYFLWGLLAAFVISLIIRLTGAMKLSMESAVIAILIFAAVAMQIRCIWEILTQDKNLFYGQFRYIMLTLPALYLGARYHKTMAIWFYGLLIPAYISLPAVLFVTNMDTNVSYAKVFAGVIAALLIYKEYAGKAVLVRCATISAVFFLFMSLFVSRLLLIRVTGCLPLTVKARMEKMEYGAEKGVYVLEDIADIWNNNYQEIESLVKPDDKLLYVGAENLIYLDTGCEIATPSTHSTTVYNEMFVHYYELHPEKLPTVIVIDKTFDENPVYGNYFGTDILLNWIEEHYNQANREETDYMIVLH